MQSSHPNCPKKLRDCLFDLGLRMILLFDCSCFKYSASWVVLFSIAVASLMLTKETFSLLPLICSTRDLEFANILIDRTNIETYSTN